MNRDSRTCSTIKVTNIHIIKVSEGEGEGERETESIGRNNALKKQIW